ncbi:hypothetical protein IMZ11_34105 [Microtetraspora sp. AC03309]|uniref:hypothetical protein n=1 Tax=Microtetraspora sp. AC03309 TaxID=2779376 RepID=UPI001E638A09|nr:hypothetical protein [Microtetraspora sp. AC03309]MCC5580664.1 hypothetical protein [Microtetraspora sp. AC03309]
MADLTSSPQGVPARSGAGTMLSLAVIVTGLVLAVTAILPWAGVTAEFGLMGTEFTHAIRGIDRGSGWFVLGAGIAATLLGVVGMTRGRLFTGFAILPGAVAALALAMFLTDPQDWGDRLSFRIPGLVDVHPTIQYGWFAALLASVLVAALSATALIRRG